MARTTWRPAAALAALLCCVSASHALVGPTVTGIVTATEPAGTPLAGAFVALRSEDDRYPGTTDATGALTIVGVAPGSYTLVAHAQRTTLEKHGRPSASTGNPTAPTLLIA